MTPLLENMTVDGFETTASIVSSIFDLMEVAEEVIAEFKKAHPNRADIIDRMFSIGIPGDLARYPVNLYRAHCRELCERLRDGEDTRPGTYAEICIAYCEASFAYPLNRNATAAYIQAFSYVMGEQVTQSIIEDNAHYREGDWKHAVNEQLTWLRKKLAKPERVVAEAGLANPKLAPISFVPVRDVELEQQSLLGLEV